MPENNRQPDCPLPLGNYDRIVLAHGGGGRLMHQLIDSILLNAYGDSLLADSPDSTAIEVEGTRLSVTTDSYVVRPLFFPGGDIGKLSVCGTVNDLAMSGAKPLYLTVGMILEEGLELEELREIAKSIGETAREDGVRIVAGDTKVVEKGHGHGIYINTAGIGIREHGQMIGPSKVEPGDAVILSGDIGRHGIAVMAAREKLPIEPPIISDCATLWKSVERLLNAGIEIHCMRDLTRGGLGAAVVEIANSSEVRVELVERNIAVSEAVRGACEILGFDPLFVANEGRFVLFVPEKDVLRAIDALSEISPDIKPVKIGSVTNESIGVTLQSLTGMERAVQMPSGEQLPRIC